MFVDDITAFLGGRNKEFPEVGEKMLETNDEDGGGREKGLELSIMEEGEEFERRGKARSLRHAVIWKILSNSLETVEWVRGRERSSWEMARGRGGGSVVLFCHKETVFQKNFMRSGTRKLLGMGRSLRESGKDKR